VLESFILCEPRIIERVSNQARFYYAARGLKDDVKQLFAALFALAFCLPFRQRRQHGFQLWSAIHLNGHRAGFSDLLTIVAFIDGPSVHAWVPDSSLIADF
jgi:hypothetical protein